MIRFSYIITVIAVLYISSGPAAALERFPPPEFESGYEFPSTTTPHPQQDIYEYIDSFVLLAALGLSAYLILKKRSRRAIFILMVFSLLYFGFWRKGCVCPIGATQNIVLSIFDKTYVIPIAVVIFFLLPLIFALFFGRVFCGAVCPLGAIQDAVLLRPVKVPYWLESALRLFAYVYLAAAVLFVATGSAFIICRYDPFVAFFRLNGNLNILIIGACLLVIGLFVGRPYCRFICPYGLLLRHLSRLSKWRVTITPDDCIKCRLCEDACPFGAIRKPSVNWPDSEYGSGKKRLAFLLVLLPILIIFCGWAGSAIRNVTSRMNPTVRLAERVYLEDTGKVQDTTDASEAFRATGKQTEELYREASNIRADFGIGGWFFGGFIGMVIGLTFISLSTWRQRTDYEADRASCLACGRCFKYCPKENERLKKIKDVGV
jgi:ferredoxin